MIFHTVLQDFEILIVILSFQLKCISDLFIYIIDIMKEILYLHIIYIFIWYNWTFYKNEKISNPIELTYTHIRGIIERGQ